MKKIIEKLVLENSGTQSFDTWGDKTRKLLFNYLKDNYVDKGYNFFKTDTGMFIITFRHGSTVHTSYSPDRIDVVAVQEKIN